MHREDTDRTDPSRGPDDAVGATGAPASQQSAPADSGPGDEAEPLVVLVDMANVVGSRPNGWWRERAGAASRLLADLARLRGATVAGPEGRVWLISGVTAVLEGAANAAADPGWVDVWRTPRGSGSSGDDLIVEVADRLAAGGSRVLAVTADRGLRDRLVGGGTKSPSGVECTGPRWLRALLDDV